MIFSAEQSNKRKSILSRQIAKKALYLAKIREFIIPIEKGFFLNTEGTLYFFVRRAIILFFRREIKYFINTEKTRVLKHTLAHFLKTIAKIEGLRD
ncbi:MAG: hypothetical protein MJZ05_03035 [Fibrobacter sp.]|nr:hypothetical protein [Fibrobacter sp.]